MDEENILDFNFWPSFSDLMLSLVLILVMVLFMVSAILNVGTINLKHVENNQKKLINAIGNVFGKAPELSQEDQNVYKVFTNESSEEDIFIENEPTMQRITFSGNILFPQDKIELNDQGKRILDKVGNILKDNIDLIREIQIQGHADIIPSRKYPSNMDLAANRAISVFKYLKDVIGIDPIVHLMSTTSFGEYKPVWRSENDSYYNRDDLERHNLTETMKERNRRIELLLFYYY